MRFSSAVIMVFMSVCLFSGLPVHAEKHAFDVHDMVSMQRIGDAQASPDGARVVFVVTTTDLEANKGRRDLWVAQTDGSGMRQLTSHEANDWSPRWAGDDVIYFLSTRSGSVQVWRLLMSGGEAVQATDLALDVESLKIAHDAFYLGLKVFPNCQNSVPCTVTQLAENASRKTTGMVFDRTFVRHWDFWKDGRRNHVFRLALGADGLGEGQPIDLMPGIDADCPTIPWGGDEDYVISPDGQNLVYTAKLVAGSEETWSTNEDLWVVPTDGLTSARCLTAANPAREGAPVFSPDGKTLAYLAMERAGYEADRQRVMLMDWQSGEVKELTAGWDRSPGGLVWSPDGSALFASADNVGNRSIFKIFVATGAVTAVVTPHTNSGPQPLKDGSLLFTRDHLRLPAEIFVLKTGEIEPAQITHINAERLADIEFGQYKQFSFVGAHGDEVFGYLVYPVNRDPAKKYPLAFLIHGGPQGAFDDHWHYRWNPQIYAGHGYAAVMIDFHGSTGYGQAFTDAIRGDWGGAPYEDLMKGLDDVLRRHRWIDPERVAAAGASYGGYMINWIQGQTDRFKALVCHDGNLDETMAYFDTEELWFPEWEHGGTPWENPEGYAKHSPINHVKNWKTPQLVIHGALDYRVVDTQGLATFNALQRLGVPSRLLYYPDENHWVLKPANSIQWHDEVLSWMDRWTAE